MKTLRYVDKKGWPDGPWQGEPDKAHWIDEATGLDCLIVRGPSGALCGYVGIPEGHPHFAKDYDKVNDVECHGGLTFSDFCQSHDDEKGICHVPEPGRPEKVWWLGFDCAHWGDISPAYDRHMKFSHYESYKNLGYVRDEVTNLARQLHSIALTPTRDMAKEKVI